MDLGIAGRKAIVNGGSAGLGFGTALALAREGADVFISARNEGRLNDACDRIRAVTAARVQAIVADHSTEEGRKAILGQCPAPDILVGTCSPPPYIEDFRSITPDDWRENFEITLISPVEFMRAVVDGMAERRWGRIVNIATAAAKHPHPWRILSGAPRSALVNYAVTLARQFAPHNVMINTLLPAMHETDGIREIYSKIAVEKGTDLQTEIDHAIRTMSIPAGRFGSAEDFGAIAALFCSQQANYIVGQSLLVDGGVVGSSLF